MTETKKSATRVAYGNALVELGKVHEAGLDAEGIANTVLGNL